LAGGLYWFRKKVIAILQEEFLRKSRGRKDRSVKDAESPEQDVLP